MTALKTATRGPARGVVLLLLLAVATGLGAGWFSPAGGGRGLDYVHALLVPALVAWVCSRALAATTTQPRWVVPVYLALALVNVLHRPHVLALSALSLAAAVVATLATLSNRRATAVASAILACVAVSASLILGLRAN